MLRASRLRSRSSPIRVLSASVTPSSGSMMSMPEESLSVHRRSPTLVAADHLLGQGYRRA
jgi:hypothetical protein